WNILDEQPELNSVRGLHSGNQASWIEMNLYMQNQLLRDSDVMSMAHGVEIRVPFLDREFVSLVLGIEPRLKYSGGLPKQLLIDSFKSDLPEPIWNRPKMGFTFPFAEWLGKSEFVKDSMSRKGKKGTDNYHKFINGQMHWSQMMSLLLLNEPLAIGH
ncbi:MAG TPA: asparagine synthase-related protein, partial [Chitinophagaceae bacterium]|nr:asparagine synthase-related protein [Chitinophagaceae bacterium]